jgi:hypothetical protein
LVEEIFCKYSFSPAFSQLRKFEIIRLRDNNSKLISYDDDQDTRRMRRDLTLYNKKIESMFVDLFVDDEIMPEIDFSRKPLYRVFKGSFEEGGRFYGGWYQYAVSKNLRKHIVMGYAPLPTPYEDKIRYTPTVELDFSGLHPRLLYSLEGIEFEGDPYWHEDHPNLRPLVKLMMIIALNASSKKATVGPFRKLSGWREPGRVHPGERGSPCGSASCCGSRTRPSITSRFWS